MWYNPDGEGGRLEGGEGAPLVAWASKDAVLLVASPFWYARRSHWWCSVKLLQRVWRDQATSLGSVVVSGFLVDGEASSSHVHQ
jgi:hypothetical protein